MSDNTSKATSTVAPGDSISSSGKKPKPGKRERAAKRSLVSGSGGVPASAGKASAFAASSMGDPNPQPGRFPVVFQAGAGEPTRDVEFCLSPRVMADLFCSFPDRYAFHPKYTEFMQNAELDELEFARHVSTAGLLRLAQQIVHSHVNVDLPQGDFAPIASSDVRVPAALSAAVSQFGEYKAPSVGVRYLLRDYAATVDHLVLTARFVSNASEGDGRGIVERFWLPMSARDAVTRFCVATALIDRLRDLDAGVTIEHRVLEEAVLGGEVPDQWEAVKQFLGDAPSTGQPDRRDRFDFVFKSQADLGNFATEWTKPGSAAVLAELGLKWERPQAGHLVWGQNSKSVFSELADNWARKSAAYAQFFELVSSQTSRNVACGTNAQLARVEDVRGIVVVESFTALSAPEFSLLACFPSTVLVSTGSDMRKVVLTTSINVSQRATEFCQLDWR